MNTYDMLLIMKLPEGGFVVQQGYRGDGCFTQQLFACTTIEEALKFIKGRLGKEAK